MSEASVGQSSGNILDRIFDSINGLTTLSIVTKVGDAEMKSEINLLDGDITTEIDREFVDGKLAGLREFHATREQQGHEIIENNINALKELAGLFLSIKDMKEKAG